MLANTEQPQETAARMRQEITARDEEAESYLERRLRSHGPYGERGLTRLILAAARLRPEDRLLDAGCGVGRFTMDAARRVRWTLAVDFSPRSIEVFDRRLRRAGVANVQTQVADLTRAKLPRQAFDVALSLGVIQHIPAAELRVEALRRIRAALRPGGRAVVMVYRWGGQIRPPRPKEGRHASGIYYVAFTPDEACALLQEAGFTQVRARGALTLPRGITRRLPASISWLEPLAAAAPRSAYRGRMLILTAINAES